MTIPRPRSPKRARLSAWFRSEALDEFTESSRLMPGFPETHSQLSYLFYRDDDSEAALAEARTALSMDPANAEAYRYLGLALYAGGHYDAALHAFDEALGREPEGSLANADVYFDMGITHRDQGDRSEEHTSELQSLRHL